MSKTFQIPDVEPIKTNSGMANQMLGANARQIIMTPAVMLTVDRMRPLPNFLASFGAPTEPASAPTPKLIRTNPNAETGTCWTFKR